MQISIRNIYPTAVVLLLTPLVFYCEFAAATSPIHTKIGEAIFQADTSESKLLPVSVPNDGVLKFVMRNSDGSRDGDFYIRAPEHGNGTQSATWMTTHKFRDGLDNFNSSQRSYNTQEVNVETTAFGNKNIELIYNAATGIDNQGKIVIDVFFVETTLDTQGAQFLTEFAPGPQSLEVTEAFLVQGPGRVYLDLVQTGSFGGGDFVLYIDGVGYTGQQTLVNAGAPILPHLTMIELKEKRVYELRLGHEDSFFGDNSGSRRMDLYFSNEPVSMSGSLAGLKGRLVSCINRTTRQQVKFRLTSGINDWNCETQGLVHSPGDKITIRVFASSP